jgi:hypothetical protein
VAERPILVQPRPTPLPSAEPAPSPTIDYEFLSSSTCRAAGLYPIPEAECQEYMYALSVGRSFELQVDDGLKYASSTANPAFCYIRSRVPLRPAAEQYIYFNTYYGGIYDGADGGADAESGDCSATKVCICGHMNPGSMTCPAGTHFPGKSYFTGTCTDCPEDSVSVVPCRHADFLTTLEFHSYSCT